MKKKTKDIESTLYCFLFIFILIFIFEVPRKAFNILRLDFNQRLSKSYDYCSERAVGFLLHIKKKHKINHPPKFIKYTGVRNPGWVFFNRKGKNNNNLTVLLNYNHKNEIFLEKINNNKFRYNFNHLYNHRNYKKIQLSYNDFLNIEKLKILSGKKIIFDFSKQDQKINYKSKIIEIEINEALNKILKENQKREKSLVFKSDGIDQISSITIIVDHIFDLNNFEIVENIGNCYLVNVND